VLPFDKFEDTYFMIKDKYESLMVEGGQGDDIDEEALLQELKNENNKEEDGRVFGVLLDHDWQLIGYVYYFLVSVANLVETKNDESPIIDNKGTIQGKVSYSVGLEVYDSSGNKQLPLINYSALSDLIGKKLKINLELKKASDIPEKLSHASIIKY